MSDTGDLETADCLADYYARIITSRHNQHSIIRIVGSAGTGKSWGAVDLFMETAEFVAEYVNGKPSEYYNFKDNLAVITKEDIKRVMNTPQKYGIKHLDDIGVGWNARKYKDDFNIFLNDILQTFRPMNNLVGMTLQSGFLIDKVPRSLAHYEIEMESANFNEGFTVAKVNRVVLKHKTGDIHYPYIFLNGTKYIRHVFERRSDEVMNEYERIRAEQLEKLNKESEEPVITVVPKLTLSSKYGHVLNPLHDKFGSWEEVGNFITIAEGEPYTGEACRKAAICYQKQLIR